MKKENTTLNYTLYKNAFKKGKLKQAEKQLLRHIAYCERMKKDDDYYYELANLRKAIQYKGNLPLEEGMEKLEGLRREIRHNIIKQNAKETRLLLGNYYEVNGGASWEYYYLLGNYYERIRECEKAYDFYEKASKLDETNPFIPIQMHSVCLYFRDIKKSQEWLDQYLKYNKGEKSFGIVKKIDDCAHHNQFDELKDLYYETLVTRPTIDKKISFSTKVIKRLEQEIKRKEKYNHEKALELREIVDKMIKVLDDDKITKEKKLEENDPKTLAGKIFSRVDIESFQKENKDIYLNDMKTLILEKEDSNKEIEPLKIYVDNLRISDQERLLVLLDGVVLLRENNLNKQADMYLKKVEKEKQSSFVHERYVKVKTISCDRTD